MMAAIPRQIKACEPSHKKDDPNKDRRLSPIFGIELYVNPMQIEYSGDAELQTYIKSLDPSQQAVMRKRGYHLLAIATNEVGYSNLVKLSSLAWTKGFYYRPRVNHEQLKKYKEGIIFTSCCYASEVGQAFDKGGEEAGFAMIEKYVEMFGRENYFLEVMLLDFVKQKPYDAFIIKAHQRYGLPLIVTNDVHFCNAEDSKYQRLMLMVQTGNTVKDIERRMSEEGMQDLFELQDQNLWMKTEEELNAKWESDYSDVIDYELFKRAKMNTVEICRRAAGVKLDRSIKLPQIDNADDKLKEAAVKGLYAKGLGRNMAYQARLKEEIALITHKEFSSYFLIQKMMTDEARRVCKEMLGWGTGREAVGPGRGCLAGDVPVVLANGRTKSIRDVKEGDFVITRDGTPGLVERTVSYDTEEDLLRLRCYYGDKHGVTLTADHKVLAEKWRRAESTKRSRKIVSEPTGQLDWVRADGLAVGDWVFVPKPATYAEPLTEIDLAEYGEGSVTSHDETYVYQDSINPMTKQIRQRKRLGRKLTLDDEWYTVMGIFAGDGWLRSDKSGRVGFCFHKGDSYGLALVRHKLESLGVPVYVRDGYRGKRAVSLDGNSRHLYNLFADWFDEYQCTSVTKHVPLFVLCADEPQVRAFLRGYHLSDGHEGYVNKFSTVSPVMADQIRYLHWRIGSPASLAADERTDPRSGLKHFERSVKTPRTEGVSLTPERLTYQFRQVEGGVMVRLRSVDIVRGVKKVYDLQVAGKHNYLTSSFLVHNSAVGSLVCYSLGITDVDPIKHDLLFKRFLSETRGGKSIKLRFKGIDPLPVEEAG